MENNFQEGIGAILNERRLKRYYGDIYKTTKRKDLLAGDPLSIAVEFVISTITNKWPKKLMQSYLLRLLAINQVAVEVKKWRSSNISNNNILHFACRDCRVQVIESIIKNCGEDLINELNSDGEPPMFFLKFNSVAVAMKNVLQLFIDKTSNGEAVLKQCLLDLETCSVSFISACLEQYESLQHTSKIDGDVILAILKYYLRDISIWNRRKYLRSHLEKFLKILKRITLSHEACMDLLQIFQRVEYGENNITVFKKERYFYHIVYLRPEILTFILKNLDHSKVRFDVPFMKFNAKYLCNHWTRMRGLDPQIELLLQMVDSPEILKALPNLTNAKLFEAPNIYTLIAEHNVYHRLTNEAFKQPVLRTTMECYLHGPAFSTTETDLVVHTIEFPIVDLPTDLIGVVMSFLPYQRLLAFSMTCTQHHRLMLDIRLIWQWRFHEGFPFDAKPKEFTRQSFVSRYKNKFYMGSPEVIEMETFFGSRTDVHQNILTNTLGDTIKLYDFETKKCAEIKSKGKRAGRSRKFGNALCVMNESTVEFYSLHDYKPAGVLNILPGLQLAEPFDINDKWLVTTKHIFDLPTGKMLAESNGGSSVYPRTTLLLRDNIVMRSKDNGSCEVLDLRTNLMNPVIVQPHCSNKRDQIPLQINASDNYMYLSHRHVEIRDLRRTMDPVWISPTAQAPYYNAENHSAFCIDLVSMNVWCRSRVVWDLINYKWEEPNRENSKVGYIAFNNVKCNGKHLIFTDDQLYKMDLAGFEYFPLSS